ncbi:hypothetical protein [uncultured Tenacibaculum sp.]|uniref:hypothetical protein n=1 Tax=uncultured Tenacibaculum sp. TaxID=174713 RepID=UPI00262B7FF7|nr:hypothetical protein [uncultured Tenacibaculum sp.]
MNKYIYILLIFFVSCNKGNNLECLYEAKNMTIDYDVMLNNKSFNSKSFLDIDGTRFYHSSIYDSIKSSNYLPKGKITLFSVEGKEAKIDFNKIILAQILSSKIAKNNNYLILNKPQILTQGIIKFKRKDNKNIVITTSEKYPVTINNEICN